MRANESHGGDSRRKRDENSKQLHRHFGHSAIGPRYRQPIALWSHQDQFCCQEDWLSSTGTKTRARRRRKKASASVEST